MGPEFVFSGQSGLHCYWGQVHYGEMDRVSGKLQCTQTMVDAEARNMASDHALVSAMMAWSSTNTHWPD